MTRSGVNRMTLVGSGPCKVEHMPTAAVWRSVCESSPGKPQLARFRESPMAKTVMVVDDAKPVRQQVGLALKEAGYEVLEAFDGQDGVEKMTSNPEIAMVICDVNMPRMNGIDFVANAMKIRNVPIVMLTTEGQPELVTKAKAAGAKGWIIKPFKPELLIAAVKKLAG